MRSTEQYGITMPPRRSHRGGVASHMLIAGIVLVAACLHARGAFASQFAFAVTGSAITAPSEEAHAQKLIDAIGRDPKTSFVVYDGNLKGAREPCNDALYDRRHALLDASRPALFFVPGENDWVTCASTVSGSYDPVERLELLRQTIFAESSSLGQNPLQITRESEVPRFRPYRENVRWQVGDMVFIALNLPDGNNHYLNAGGRNGEFEDRVIANGFWLQHAAEYAKRRNARAIVIFVQGNPLPERTERPDRFAWLRFGHRTRDGYLEFRHSLAKLAQTFGGPVVLVDTADSRLARGFVIDQPLRNEKEVRIANVTRIAFALHDPLTQWLQVDVDMKRQPPLRVSVRSVPEHLPPLSPSEQPPLLPRDGTSAEMPEVSSMPDVSEIPGFQQVPPETGASPADGASAPPPPQPAAP